MRAEEKDILKLRILEELTKHVGRTRALGMGELYRIVFGKGWANRINDTRDLRILIRELRRKGQPICSTSGRQGGGYYLASAGSELNDYCTRLRVRALKILNQEARIRRISLPDLVGQIHINMKEKEGN